VRNAARHGLSGGAGSILVHIIERAGPVRGVVCDNGCRCLARLRPSGILVAAWQTNFVRG